MPVNVNGAQFYELHETAAELRIGIATLYRWMQAGRIRPVRLLNRTLIPAEEVARLSRKRAKNGL